MNYPHAFLFFFLMLSCSGTICTFFFGGQQEAQLTKAHSDRDSRRRLKGQITDEKNALKAHVELLERLVSLLCINTTYFSGD